MKSTSLSKVFCLSTIRVYISGENEPLHKTPSENVVTKWFRSQHVIAQLEDFWDVEYNEKEKKKGSILEKKEK